MEKKLPLWLTDPSESVAIAREKCQDSSGVIVCGATLKVGSIDGEPIAIWECDTCDDPDTISAAAEVGIAQE